MELKVVCQCGQKFKFDVEPVNGLMPFTVNCPVCQQDGTATANAMLAEILGNVSTPAPAPAPAPTGRLRIHLPSSPAQAPAAEAEPAVHSRPAPLRPQRVAASKASAETQAGPTSFGRGLLGGLIGAFVGAIIYLIMFKYSGYQIKLLAIGVGALAGWMADYFSRGEGSKELGGITAVFVLVGIVGAQYFVALGWWNEIVEEDLKSAAALYDTSVAEARDVMKVIPNGSDSEIRIYLVKLAAKEGDPVSPESITREEIKGFRDNELPEYRALASGQMAREQFEKKHEIKTALTAEEKKEDESTFKAVFLLLFLSKVNLFSLAAAAALAFKMSTNA